MLCFRKHAGRKAFKELMVQHSALTFISEKVVKDTQAFNGVIVSTHSASVCEEFSGIRDILAASSPVKVFPWSSVLGGLN